MNGPWGKGRFERVLVYGLGASGRAAARFLLGRGVEVLAADAKAVDAGDLTGERFRLLPCGEPKTLAELPRPVDGVVVSPGVPMDRPLLEAARQAGLPVIAEVELAFPFLNGPVIGITGTNGKSTTTALTGALLTAAGFAVEVCGNIGDPLSNRIEGAAGRAFVVELSSFQIEGIEIFKPQAAAFLNVTEDHLDRYATLADYVAAKARLFANLDERGIAVVNADDPVTAAVVTRARKRFFSRRGPVVDGCFVDEAGTVSEVAPGEPVTPLFAAGDVPLAGVQNLENAMAAALLARALGAPAGAIRRGLAGFRGLPHRLERVAERAGVAFYDDSKGTNPAATAKSIEGFRDGSLHLILGGRNKGADLAALTPLLARKVKRAYLIGEAAEEFAAALTGAVPFELAGTMAEAVRSAAQQAAAGDSVVLSPACASFDQFDNYKHRGETFQRLVRALPGGPHGEEAGL